MRRRLGPGPRFERDIAALKHLYDAHRDDPTVRVKRQLWRSLLAAALGVAVEEQADLDELFLRHTYLSVVVGLAVQAAFGIPIVEQAEHDSEALLSGRVFVEATGVRGVVESDFFAWPAEVGGDVWLRAIARRIARFEWERAEYDVARILYESVIPADERRRLGEYYTPDWLAREIVDTVVTDPLNQRVLDPACGSGTFIFAAVRKYLAAARAVRRDPASALDGLLNHVFGIDVHPVSVHLARATWTFAARDALERARDAGSHVDVTVPIYLGDSLQLRTQPQDMFATQTVTIEIGDEPESGLERNRFLAFPRALVEQADWFDGLMTRLAAEIEAGGDPALALYDADISDSGPEREMLDRTAETLQQLHAEGRDHIWAYYTRNLVRPLALAKDKVDVIVGNPPWLTYNRSDAIVRAELETQSKARYQIWAGGQNATNQNIAGLFFARCVDLYLKEGGEAAMVLPHSALQTGPYAKWRDGDWGDVRIDFAVQRPWDLERIEPNTFFPVPSCVAFARKLGREARPRRFASQASRWHGPAGGPFERESVPLVDTSGAFASIYGERTRNGATIYPRALFLVDVEASRTTLRAQNVVTVSPRRSPKERGQWKNLKLPQLQSQPIEAEHIWDVHLGETVAPFVLLEPLTAVLPISRNRTRIVHESNARNEVDERSLGERMRRRWQIVCDLWDAHKLPSERKTLLGRLNYNREVTAQLERRRPTLSHDGFGQVVYTANGRPTAAILSDSDAIVDNALMRVAVQSPAEARFLLGLINSRVVEELATPLMSQGQFGGRNLKKHIWRLPIPEYDESDPLHREIAEAAAEAAQGAEAVLRDVRAQRAKQGKATSITIARREIRVWLAVSPEGQRVERLVSDLLG